MTFLALDIGSKRIGVAYAIAKNSAVVPLKVVKVSGDYVQKILSLLDEYEVETLVIGQPNNLSGSSSSSNELVKTFLHKVDLGKTRPQIKVELVDERFTTKIAQTKLRDIDVDIKKSREYIDSLAAVEILNSHLATQ